jgi:hypothetical protein
MEIRLRPAAVAIVEQGSCHSRTINLSNTQRQGKAGNFQLTHLERQLLQYQTLL